MKLLQMRRSCLLLLLAGAALGLAGGSMVQADPPEEREWPQDISADFRKDLGRIEKEIARLRTIGEVEKADKMSAKFERTVAQFTGPFQVNDPESPTVHAFSVYRGTVNAKAPQVQNRAQGTVTVKVQAIGQPCVLVLAGYDPVKWTIELEEGAEVQKIFLSGYHPQELASTPEGAEVVDFSTAATRSRIGYLTSALGQARIQFEQFVRVEAGIPVSTLHVETIYRGKPFVLGPENRAWVYQYLESELADLRQAAVDHEQAVAQARMAPVRFLGVYQKPGDHQRAKMELCEFTPAGPLANTGRKLPRGTTHVAHDTRDDVWYGLVNRKLCRIEPGADKAEPVTSKGGEPQISWPTGLLFDAQRRRLLVPSYGTGAGIYEYDIDVQAWGVLMLDRTVEHITLNWDQEKQNMIGLSMPYPRRQMSICRVAPDGGLISSQTIDGKVEFNRSPLEPVQIFSVGGYAVLLLPAPRGPTNEHALPAKLFVIEVDTGKIEYEGEVAEHASVVEVDDEQLADDWRQLADDDDHELAMWRLVAGGSRTASIIAGDLSTLGEANPEKVQELIRLLDDDDYATREAAAAELEALGPAAGEQLRAAQKSPSPQVQKQVQRLMILVLLSAEKSPGTRREVRAARILFRMGTPEAVAMLKDLADDLPLHPRTIAAKTGLLELGELNKPAEENKPESPAEGDPAEKAADKNVPAEKDEPAAATTEPPVKDDSEAP
ncbi:HEAT repeat domain-containing protein [Lignipirellula cremea]|uniref:HEAT repeat protein n=1 Tax=Lignipirellula cremea TaxID=2528010 RepID=A0A518E0T8_9BACT|nr:hypothetical protein [Lignipirellula cremea]QDU97706.1 hypothetical protein Pla8534_55590 [Lignipirellula cremea]